MGETPNVLSQIEQFVTAKLFSFFSIWAGMVGGSATAFLAGLGDHQLATGIGVVVAVVGMILKAWHNYALRRQAARIEYAKMTPDQRAVFDKT